MTRLVLFGLLLSLSAAACGKKGGEETTGRMFQLMPAAETGVAFVNELTESDSMNQLIYNYAYNGGGVAAGDLNNDGLDDLIFTGNTSPSKVYFNQGEFKFKDVTQASGITPTGWCSGVNMVDINNDGWLDVYISRSGPDKNPANRANLLYINNKNGTFTEQAAAYGLADQGHTTQAAFFDMDNDGDLDCFVANHALPFFKSMDVTYSRSMMQDPWNSQRMYENKDGKFTDISKAAGMDAMGYGLSATPGDFNRDGLVDLYVCNDYFIPDFFYLNLGNGKFREALGDYFKHTSLFSMGSDAADYNNDGWTDLFTCDMLPTDPRRYALLQGPPGLDNFMVAQQHGYGPQFMHNTLQTNRSGKGFSDLAFLTGTAKTDWSWSPLFADFDNDGRKDLYVTNGYLRDVNNLDFIMYMGRLRQKENRGPNFREIANELPYERLSNFMYRNTGDLSFQLRTEEWGLNHPSFSAGSTIADLDNDGRMDLVVSNIQDTSFIYRNIGKQGNWLKAKLKGNGKANSFGLGAKLILETDSGRQFLEVNMTRGYQGSVSAVQHFGLGGAAAVKSLTVVWPGGSFQTIANPGINKTIELDAAQASGTWSWPEENPGFNFTSSPAPAMMHKEEDIPDFRREFLLPHRLSQLGPGLCAADVNGDGLDDVFAGNGRNGGGAKLWLQQTDGSFRAAGSNPWASIPADIMGCLFVDADNDGDPDLYVVPGGSEYGWPTDKYKHRFYLNDGKGNFSEDASRIPLCDASGSCVVAADYDLDGDLDLFVGGRMVPGMYPVADSRSYVLRNDGGKFADVTAQLFPGLQRPGMVCAAVWSDFNNDTYPDLILSGEWMPPVFLQNNAGRSFSDQTQAFGMHEQIGWFNSILPTDADNDGDMDYIIGNKGWNSQYRATRTEPLGVYWSDFDNNGRIDLLLTYSVNGREYPINSYDELALQTPGVIRRKFVRYGDFAGKPVQEVFEGGMLKTSMHANQFASLLLRNNGGSLSVETLPAEAQAAPLYGMLNLDVNGDGAEDIICVGNHYTTRVEFGYDNALNGLVLVNDGSGRYKAVDGRACGFVVPGDGKSLIAFGDKEQIKLLAAENNGPLRAFKPTLSWKRVAAQSGETHAIIELKGGKKRKVELFPGRGYLSQSAALVQGGETVQRIVFYKGGQVSRTVN